MTEKRGNISQAMLACLIRVFSMCICISSYRIYVFIYFNVHARSKRLWLDGFLKLNSVLTAKELSDLQEVMRDKELNLRTDIYEILLQES